jgi:hypothetical protein
MIRYALRGVDGEADLSGPALDDLSQCFAIKTAFYLYDQSPLCITLQHIAAISQLAFYCAAAERASCGRIPRMMAVMTRSSIDAKTCILQQLLNVRLFSHLAC